MKPAQHTIPSVAWLHEAKEETKFTPDIWRLEQFIAQWLFCPDETQQGHPKHEMLKSEGRRATGYTVAPYTVFRHKLGQHSKVIPLPLKFQVDPYLKIKGEMHLISPSTFIKLDEYKQNGVQFERLRVMVEIPFREVLWNPAEQKMETQDRLFEGSKCVPAWMYVGKADYWEPLLDGGYSFARCKAFKPKKDWLQPYYYHTKTEYDDL